MSEIKLKVLLWLKSFSTFTYLDNNLYPHQPNRFELLVGAGNAYAIPTTQIGTINDWHFGHLTYDYKNVLFPRLYSKNRPTSTFKLDGFFVPEVVIQIPFGTNTLLIESLQNDTATIWDAIVKQDITSKELPEIIPAKHTIHHRFFEESSYQQTVNAIRNHIEEGDCYELNLVNGKIIEHYVADPFFLFQKLNQLNPAPFSCLYRNDDDFLISSSPERYLYKAESRILSQPIKGTIKRGDTPEKEALAKQQLFNDVKERAENVMIVDLVRNDLAKISEVASVKVPELFGVYTFKQLHHLISTISATLKPNLSLYKIITEPFPMGSMTGAPKYIVMELIEQYEQFQRNIYSGTVGYIMPNHDFDFNVVIRSLVYNVATQRIVFHTGGAITYDSSAEKEWQETLLKALAMETVLKNEIL